MKKDRREKERLYTDRHYAHFSENESSYTGIIEDISESGLRVRLCPVTSKFMSGSTVSWFQGALIRTTSNYLIKISDNPDATESASNSVTLKVRPRWRKKENGKMLIGFNIVDPPSDWEQFMKEIALVASYQVAC